MVAAAAASVVAMASSVKGPGISVICYKNMKFIIMDRPSDATMPQLVDQLRRCNVTDVIRICEPSYKTNLLSMAGIAIHDWQFDDGSPPPQDIIDKWFELLRHRYKESGEVSVAVHCVAGLGRGPVMVALALLELGMKYEDTVEFIRERRRGAFNQKQLRYLSTYKPRYRLGDKESKCAVI